MDLKSTLKNNISINFIKKSKASQKQINTYCMNTLDVGLPVDKEHLINKVMVEFGLIYDDAKIMVDNFIDSIHGRTK